ncbi:hypothetical protein CEXT_599341 [Caerostris extrusa]|uniref:Uncharacterized protein n=1 Tax=Caerostris extrusa TaxID=172846 RepID=A0AAV4PA31_CAEEX|nr:hypothetical protein CEXT_599341 [Caerostris extrusa]
MNTAASSKGHIVRVTTSEVVRSRDQTIPGGGGGRQACFRTSFYFHDPSGGRFHHHVSSDWFVGFFSFLSEEGISEDVLR